MGLEIHIILNISLSKYENARFPFCLREEPASPGEIWGLGSMLTPTQQGCRRTALILSLTGKGRGSQWTLPMGHGPAWARREGAAHCRELLPCNCRPQVRGP